MLTKNLDVARGLVNGARGVVVAFESGKHGEFLIILAARSLLNARYPVCQERGGLLSET